MLWKIYFKQNVKNSIFCWHILKIYVFNTDFWRYVLIPKKNNFYKSVWNDNIRCQMWIKIIRIMYLNYSSVLVNWIKSEIIFVSAPLFSLFDSLFNYWLFLLLFQLFLTLRRNILKTLFYYLKIYYSYR